MSSFLLSSLSIVILVGGIGLVVVVAYRAYQRDRAHMEQVCDQLNEVKGAVEAAAHELPSSGGSGLMVIGESVSEEQWNLLVETLHGTPVPHEGRIAFRLEGGGGRLFRVTHPLEKLAAQATADSPVRSVTGLCIMIGVAGTFLGISLGLLGLDTATTSATLQSASQLIDGMRTSFWTSLGGLACAGWLTLKINKHKAKRRQALQEAQDSIDKRTLPMTASHLLAQSDPGQAKAAADANVQAAKSLSTSSKQLERGVAELAGAARGLSADAIGDSVGKSVRGAINDQLQPIFQEISQELKQLREIKADQGQKTLKLLIEQMRDEVLEPMGQQLHQSAELTTQAIQSVDALRGVVEDAVSHMRDDLDRIQGFQDETLSQMRTFATELQSRVEHVMNQSLDSVDQLANDMAEMVDRGVEAMDAQRAAFDESTQHAQAAFSDVGERLGTALDAHTKEAEALFQRVTENVEAVQNRFENAFAEQNDILTTIGEEASNTMREASKELTASTVEIRDVLGDTRDVTQEELEQFRIAYQQNLEDFFVAQNNLLEETLGEQRDALQDAVSALREAMRQSTEEQRDLLDLMDARLTSMVDTMEQIEGFASRLGMMSGKRTAELRSMTDDLSRAVDELRVESGKIRSDLEKSHRISQDNLEAYIQRTEAHQQQFFETADEAVGELGEKLLEISEGVDYAAETLVSAVEHQQHMGNGSTT